MEDFASLEKIVDETINQAIAEKQLIFGNFIQRMEAEFTRLGFRKPPARGGVQNILILRIDRVGDFILTSPAIREIRMNYPAAYITLAVEKSVYPVAELCPYVNEVIVFDEKPNVNDLISSIQCSKNFCKKYLWRRKYDLSFSFRYWGDGWQILGMLILYMSGAFHRVSYRYDAIRLYYDKLLPKEQNISYALLTHPILNPKEIVHDCARSLYLVQAYGVHIRHTDLEVWYNKADLVQAENLMGNFGEGRIKVAVCIGCSAAVRKYPVELYLFALKEIISRGASIVFLGGPSEMNDVKFLEENLPKEFVKNIIGFRAGWRVDCAIISQCDMYIGNDTGTQHIAAALKKPVIVLSRVAKDIHEFLPNIPSEADMYRSWQNNSITLQPEHQLEPCRNLKSYAGCLAGKSHCIAQINPAEIVKAFDKMLSIIRELNKNNYPQIIRNIDQVSPLKLKEGF